MGRDGAAASIVHLGREGKREHITTVCYKLRPTLYKDTIRSSETQRKSTVKKA